MENKEKRANKKDLEDLTFCLKRNLIQQQRTILDLIFEAAHLQIQTDKLKSENKELKSELGRVKKDRDKLRAMTK